MSKKEQLKQLHQIDSIEGNAESDDGNTDDDEVAVPSKKMNRFAMLDSDKEEKADSESDDHHQVPVQKPSSSAPKKNPKKKNNKKKNKAAASQNVEVWTELPAKTSAIDKMSDLLKISFADLNPDAELRKILGPAFRAPPSHKGNSGRKMPSFRIIPKKPEWPSTYDSGLSVVLDDGAPKIKGVKYYRFEHNAGYQETQQIFWDIAQIPGADFQTILENSRYHVDTLLILAEQVAQHDDAREARNLTEFALYVCESAFPNGFETLSASTRLDYNWRENRCFFLLLLKHMKFLLNRRCFLTALNVAKLIIMKDPVSDPLGMHLIVDSLALKSGQYQFLLDYYEHFKVARHIDSLPNMMYSNAFAHHFLALEKDDPDLEIISQHLLFEAITSFPLILFEICEEMKIKATPKVVKALQLDPMTVTFAPEGLRLLCKIYINHSLEDIWKKDGFMNWIEASVESIVNEREKEINEKISNLKQNYKKVYVGIPEEIARHGYLFDLYSCSTGLPAIDPFPPSSGRHRSGYEKREQPMNVRQEMGEEGSANRILEILGQAISSFNPGYNQNAAAANVGEEVPGFAAIMERIGRMWPNAPAADGEEAQNPQQADQEPPQGRRNNRNEDEPEE